MKTILLLTLLSSSLAIAAPQLLMDTDTLFPESKLTLSFSKPVVSPDMVGKDAKNTLIEISPALDAKLTWTAPSVAVLQLSTGPELGKSYTFTMKDGQAFADASPIEAGKLATLPAPPFQSENSRRSGTTRTPSFSRVNTPSKFSGVTGKRLTSMVPPRSIVATSFFSSMMVASMARGSNTFNL